MRTTEEIKEKIHQLVQFSKANDSTKRSFQIGVEFIEEDEDSTPTFEYWKSSEGVTKLNHLISTIFESQKYKYVYTKKCATLCARTARVQRCTHCLAGFARWSSSTSRKSKCSPFLNIAWFRNKLGILSASLFFGEHHGPTSPFSSVALKRALKHKIQRDPPLYIISSRFCFAREDKG